MTRHNHTNVLWVVDHIGHGEVLHGPGRYYLNMIPLFDREQYNVHLCVLRGQKHLHKPLQDRGFTVHHLNRGRFDPRTLFDLLRILGANRVMLVHLSGYGSSNFGRLAAHVKGIPAIIGAYDEDSNYPFVQRVADYLLRNSQALAIAASQAVKRACVQLRSMPAERVAIVHTGIPPDHFADPIPEDVRRVRATYGIPPEASVVGTLSRLRKEKGIQFLVEAAPRVLKDHPDTYFLIVGDGPQGDELRALAARLGVGDRVIFAGYCTNPRPILSSMDIMVLPSLHEGFSAAIQEAMALRKPIVATNVGGTVEMIEEGVTGLLVPPSDARALAGSISFYLMHGEQGRRMGERGFAASRRWGLDLLVKDVEQLYAEALENN